MSRIVLGLMLFGCAAAEGPAPAGPDGAAPGADDAGDAGHPSDASARIGDNEEAYSAVPVYGAPGCDFAPDGGAISPMLGGAVVAVAAVALLRRRRAGS